MSYSLYRKYRPKTFSDLLGQESVQTVLQNAAKQKAFSHAYLFYGPRGTGKTTAARLLAKLANCLTRVADIKFATQGEPCNTCDACLEIDSGRALDVIEIDAASNRGIDEIRSLKESVRISPTRYVHKIFIIDEVHMLTKDAFNALLKTLEEPPAHVMMILATTEYDKVPATITSRVQRMHFRRLMLKEIIKKLETIVKLESLRVTPDALEFIATVAEGSLRDAESLLSQVAAMRDEVNVMTVERIIGRVSRTVIRDVASALLAKDIARTLQLVQELFTQGHNLVDFTKELITYLRRVLAVKFDPTLAALLENELPHEEVELLKTQSATLVVPFVIALLRSLIRAYCEMRYSPVVLAPLEVAVVESITATTLTTQDISK